MQIRATVRYHFTTIRMSTIKNPENPPEIVGYGMENWNVCALLAGL